MPRVIRAQRKFWCFTDFGDGIPFDHSVINHKYSPAPDGISYIVWQLESCPDTHREHVQGYLECERTRHASWLKNNISATAHFEVRRGTALEASNYCKKEDSRVHGCGPFESGTISNAKCLEDVRQQFVEGLVKIFDAWQYMKLNNFYVKE